MTTHAYGDLEAYIARPRVSGLVLSPDGTRLVTTVATLDPKRTRYVSALWEVDPAGTRAARRLTRSAKGEGGAAFLPDGSLLFTSGRPDPDVAPPGADDPVVNALWLLPAGGGEARVVATRPGGVSGLVAARHTGTMAVASMTLPGATTGADDGERRKARRDRKVSAILHESSPIRHWDHDLGPARSRLCVGAFDADTDGVELTDLTGHVGGAIDDEAAWTLSPDGTQLVTTWVVPEARGSQQVGLVRIDVATGGRHPLVDADDHEYGNPVFSPDGLCLASVRARRSTVDDAPVLDLVVVDVPSGAVRALAPGWDRWPNPAVWAPDGAAVFVTADDDGRAPVFRVDVATGTVTRLTGDHGAYSDVQVAPDGNTLYALRSAIDAPPTPVRLDARAADQQSVLLRGPAAAPELPGTLTEVTAVGLDGAAVRAWLALPHGADVASPAPLLLWIHGGPLSSWNAWSWRWNPWLAVAHGYAVLLPDPALSTGYGQAFVQRGWGRWGEDPYTDLMAITDAAVGRPDIDGERTAAMGGSFGGYMANWIAGSTDRFRAIVTHASLWALDQFGPTTDGSFYWRRELSPERALANSPHRRVADIVTPLLVIHGDKDYRVPIGEAVRLWSELFEHHGAADGTLPHKFLYFPDENHWILTPQHAIVWYQTVLAFLDHHVLGRPWETPALLR